MKLKYEFFGKEELMTLNLGIIDLRKDRLGEETSVLDIVCTRKKEEEDGCLVDQCFSFFRM